MEAKIKPYYVVVEAPYGDIYGIFEDYSEAKDMGTRLSDELRNIGGFPIEIWKIQPSVPSVNSDGRYQPLRELSVWRR